MRAMGNGDRKRKKSESQRQRWHIQICQGLIDVQCWKSKSWMSVSEMWRGDRKRKKEEREGAREKVGYYSQTTWGMFTEFNNSKCHHFIGFMDGYLSPIMPHSFHHPLSLSHSHSPTCSSCHCSHYYRFLEKWQGTWIKRSKVKLHITFTKPSNHQVPCLKGNKIWDHYMNV